MNISCYVFGLFVMTQASLLADGVSNVDGHAYEVDSFEQRYGRYKDMLDLVNWLQNFADGYWVFGKDLEYLDKSKIGSRTMSAEDVRFSVNYVQYMEARWGGLAIYLQGYRYHDVVALWHALKRESEKKGVYAKEFRMVRAQTPGGRQTFETTSIKLLHLEAMDKKRTPLSPDK